MHKIKVHGCHGNKNTVIKYRSIKLSDLFSLATIVCTSTGAPYIAHKKHYENLKIAGVRNRSKRAMWLQHILLYLL